MSYLLNFNWNDGSGIILTIYHDHYESQKASQWFFKKQLNVKKLKFSLILTTIQCKKSSQPKSYLLKYQMFNNIKKERKTRSLCLR